MATLQEDVDEQRRSIRTDGYPMSINELATMYKEGELELHPEFQRYYRWTDEQKSRLIESLLLGIPIPSFFVYQRPDAVWDVVDGLQRLSAIFQLMGILKDVNGDLVPPLTLTGTKYLPSLSDRKWGSNEADPTGLGGDLQRVLKRSKLDIKIVLRESDADTRLELFQRLNTGGSDLSAQELRNCLILMVAPNLLETLREFASTPSFIATVGLSDRNLEEQYDIELIVRFVVLRNRNTEGLGALGPMLDDEIVRLAKTAEFDWAQELDIFKRTFDSLSASLGLNCFRRCDASGTAKSGGFIVSLYEIFALGLGNYYENEPDLPLAKVSEIHRGFWADQNVLHQFRGKQAGDRLRTTLPTGRSIFRS